MGQKRIKNLRGSVPGITTHKSPPPLERRRARRKMQKDKWISVTQLIIPPAPQGAEKEAEK
jgi:hypothetical protein